MNLDRILFLEKTFGSEDFRRYFSIPVNITGTFNVPDPTNTDETLEIPYTKAVTQTIQTPKLVPGYNKQYIPQDEQKYHNVLQKIASQEGEYSKYTPEQFWEEFANVNPVLYRHLLRDYPHIANYKVAMISYGQHNSNPHGLEEYDKVTAEKPMETFRNFIDKRAQESSAATTLKQTPPK